MEHNLKSGAGVVLLAVVLCGCGVDTGLSPLSRDAVVLAFGDSLTRGIGAAADASYPARLAAVIGRRVVGSGVPGEVSAEGLTRLPEVLARHQPDLVLLLHGGNDVLRRLPTEDTRDNLDAMVRLIRGTGAEVVLIAVPARSLMPADLSIYVELADAHGVPVLSGVVGEIIRSPALKADPVHPNAEGYRVLAEEIAGFMKERGAV